MYPSAGRALHTLGRKVGGGGGHVPPVPPPGSAASVNALMTIINYRTGANIETCKGHGLGIYLQWVWIPVLNTHRHNYSSAS